MLLLRLTESATVLFDEPTRCDVFFVTTTKSERDYSPTTMYRDYAISPELFHWESQGATAADSAMGRRYQQHAKLGTHVLLFVRRRKTDERGLAVPYRCLGLADYVRHEGERPMAITWRLHREMPAGFFVQTRLAAARGGAMVEPPFAAGDTKFSAAQRYRCTPGLS